MQEYPHHYRVAAGAESEGDVYLTSAGVAPLLSAPPAEFDGPGDRWSPEALLVAAVADCFILSFRGVAGASDLPWISLECEVEGTLERVEGTTKFTGFNVNAALYVPEGINEDKAHRLLEKAEAVCLITSSLSAPTHLRATVTVKP